MYHITETYSEAKSAVMPSEDGMTASPYYIAVVDGATSKGPASHTATDSAAADDTADIGTPGHAAMQTVCQSIAGFPPGLTARQAADWMTEAIQSLWELYADAPGCRPAAAAVIYSVTRREVWQIGDCPFMLDGIEHRGTKRVDTLLAAWRARATRRLMAEGHTVDRLRATDPGRDAILPYLLAQTKLQNAAPGDTTRRHHNAIQRRAYGVVDGTPIPDPFIRVYPLTPGPHTLVLATDGYPRLYPTLRATETHLQQLLIADPLCIGPLCGTKGVHPGANSYDDRTYVSIRVD